MNLVIKIFFCTQLAIITLLIFLGFAHFLDLIGALKPIAQINVWSILKDLVGMIGSLATALTLVYLVIDNALKRQLEANSKLLDEFLSALSQPRVKLSNSDIQIKWAFYERSVESLTATTPLSFLPKFLQDLMLGDYRFNQEEKIRSTLRTNFFPNIDYSFFLNSVSYSSNTMLSGLVEHHIEPISPFFPQREDFLTNAIQVSAWFVERIPACKNFDVFGCSAFTSQQEKFFWEFILQLLELEDPYFKIAKRRTPNKVADYLYGKGYRKLAAVYFVIENIELREDLHKLFASG